MFLLWQNGIIKKENKFWCLFQGNETTGLNQNRRVPVEQTVMHSLQTA